MILDQMLDLGLRLGYKSFAFCEKNGSQNSEIFYLHWLTWNLTLHMKK